LSEQFNIFLYIPLLGRVVTMSFFYYLGYLRYGVSKGTEKRRRKKNIYEFKIDRCLAMLLFREPEKKYRLLIGLRAVFYRNVR
jgi:hypothetical protein